MRLFLLLAYWIVVCSSDHEIMKREAKSNDNPAGRRVVCYYTNWSVYRKGLAKYTPQNINPYLCTHLVYAFGGLTDDFEVTTFDSYQDIEQGGYAQFNGLKQYNKDLKTLLALGGWNEGSARFSELVSLAEYRRNFTYSTIKHLRRYNFDGLDLDWEYPGSRDGSTPDDKHNYALLVKELREAFELEASKSSKERLLVTMAVPAGKSYIDKGYDIPSLNRNLDFFNLLTYDYHSVYEPTINHHSGLYAPPGTSEFEVNAQLNVDWTIRYYLQKGASKDKLVLGIPTYGRSYTLLEPDFFSFGSSADGPGAKGNYTNEKGYMSFYEICESISVDGWEVRKPYPKRVGPFAFKANQWVGYDDEDVVIKKTEYVRDNELGGVMFWTIDSDDFRGLCNGRQYPLIEAAKETLYEKSATDANEAGVPSTDIKASSNAINGAARQRNSASTDHESRRRPGGRRRQRPNSRQRDSIDPLNTPKPPTTPSSVKGFNCKREGFYPDPDNCRNYYWCLSSGNSGLGIVAHQFTCPSDLIFSKRIDGCDHPDRVKCNIKPKGESKGAQHTTTVIPTTTEYEILLEDYDYYYDGIVDPIPSNPLLENGPQILKTIDDNDLQPIKNAGGRQFQDPPPSVLKDVLLESKNLREETSAPVSRPTVVRSRPQYNSIQRTRSSSKTNTAVDDQNQDSKRTTSRQRRPQYTNINRRRKTSRGNVRNQEPAINEELVTESQQPELNYVTLNRRRRPPTSPPTTGIESDNAAGQNSGRDYVTIKRRRPVTTPEPQTTTALPLDTYDYLYEDLLEYVISDNFSTDAMPDFDTTVQPLFTSTIKDNQPEITSSTARPTSPPRIRIPPRLRGQNINRRRQQTSTVRRRPQRVGSRQTTISAVTQPDETTISQQIPSERAPIPETTRPTRRPVLPKLRSDSGSKSPNAEEGESLVEETLLLFKQDKKEVSDVRETTSKPASRFSNNSRRKFLDSRRRRINSSTSRTSTLDSPIPVTTIQTDTNNKNRQQTDSTTQNAKSSSVNQIRKRPTFQLPASLLPTSLRESTTLSGGQERNLPEDDDTSILTKQSNTSKNVSFMDLISSSKERKEDNAEANITPKTNSELKPHFILRPIEVPPTTTTERSKPTFLLDFTETEFVDAEVDAVKVTSNRQNKASTTTTPLDETTETSSIFESITKNVVSSTAITKTRSDSTKAKTPTPTSSSTARARALDRIPQVSSPPVTASPTQTKPPRPRPTAKDIPVFNPVIYEYIYDYDYVDKGALSGALGDLASLLKKATLKPDGTIECMDTGYFPHPDSCKQFISCSKTVRGFLRGWVYTCPEELVFDPVGGMCNWTEEVDCIV